MADLLNLHTGISAYNDVQKAAGSIFSGAKVENGGFSDMLTNVLGSAKKVFTKSEDMTSQAVHNKASITDVVTAVSEAEVALQTMVALRDKLINVYNDVMKMQM